MSMLRAISSSIRPTGRSGPFGTIVGRDRLRRERDGQQVHCLETHCSREQVEATNGNSRWMQDKKSVRIGNRCKINFHVDSDLVDVFDLRSDPMENRILVRGMPDQ